MKTLLRKLFLENWQRKIVALILAMILWMVVNHSLTSSKTVHDVAVRIINIPDGKTVEGIQTNGVLNKRLSLSMIGNKTTMNQLKSNDLEVVIDASQKDGEWIATIQKNNLISKNSNLDIHRKIHKVHEMDLILHLSNLIKEKIPVVIDQPIGEAPKGFQYNDIFPSRLYLTAQGPEEIVNRLKTTGVKLSFNLNEITREDLINAKRNSSTNDEIFFEVPPKWKKIKIPSLSEKPFVIDDPRSKTLQIGFLEAEYLPIEKPIAFDVFYPDQYSSTLNPDTFSLSSNAFIQKHNGIKVTKFPLFAKGVSKTFLDIVKDRIEIVAIVAPRSERKYLLWNVQFIYPSELEDQYVSKVLSQKDGAMSAFPPNMREEYLRNRFRSYMNQFRLYTQDREKLSLKIKLKTNTIEVTPINSTMIVENETSCPLKKIPLQEGGN